MTALKPFIQYKSGYKYQLQGHYCIETDIVPDEPIDLDFLALSTSGLLTVKHGYAWDGVSGTLDRKCTMRASLVHDAFYQLMRMNLIPREYKDEADGLYRDIAVEDGSFKWYANIHLRALRRLGKKNTLHENMRKIHTAPINQA